MIIVTGGAGFIGSNLVRGLNKRGHGDVLVVDNLTNASKHLNLNSLRFSDFVDKEDFFAALPGIRSIEAVFHQGACSSTIESDGRYMMRNNYEFSKRLFQFAVAHKIPFLYASSAAVYGDGGSGFAEERACEYPLNVYGFSKLAFDNYVRLHLDNVGSPVVGLRYFNVYGPQEHHKGRMASVAFHLYRQLSGGEKMRLFEGSGEFRRDFIHVDDVVAVNLFFLEKPKSGVFNCGTGEARSFSDIAAALSALHGGGDLAFLPFPDDLRGKYQTFTEASLDRLRAAGYDREFLSLEKGLERYHGVLHASGGYYR